MARLRSRAHIVRVTTVTGAAEDIDFNLNPGSRLIHVSLRPPVQQAPIRVLVNLIQPRKDSNIFMALEGGWIRAPSGGPLGSHALVWDGDLEIDTDMALRFTIRNETASDAILEGTFVMVE